MRVIVLRCDGRFDATCAAATSHHTKTQHPPDHKSVPISSRCHTAAGAAPCLEEDSLSSGREE